MCRWSLVEAEGGHEGDAGEDVMVRLTASVQEVPEAQGPEHREAEMVVHPCSDPEPAGTVGLVRSHEVYGLEVVFDQSLSGDAEVCVEPDVCPDLGAQCILVLISALEAAMVVHDATEQAESRTAIAEYDSASDMRLFLEVHDGRDPEVEARMREPPVSFRGERLAHQDASVLEGGLGLALEVQYPHGGIVILLFVGV